MRFHSSNLWSRPTRALTLATLIVLPTACSEPGRSLGRARAAGGDGAVVIDAGGNTGDDAVNDPGDVHLDPSAPAGAEDAFGGPAAVNAARTAGLVYPLPETMLASNTHPLTLQWRRPQGGEIFRVRVFGSQKESRAYAGVGACTSAGCAVSLPDRFWAKVASAHAGGSLSIVVDSVAAAGEPVYSSPPRPVFIAPAPLSGALTYWSSSINGLLKQQLGQAPTTHLSPKAGPTQGRCVGCHAVSRDGCATAAATEVSFANRQLLITNAQGESRSAVPGNESVFHAWSPDRKYLLTVLHGKVSLRDARGVWLDELPLALIGEGAEGYVSHADWAPDGSFIVFTRLAAGAQKVDPIVYAGDIVKVPFRGVKDYGPAETLVAHTASSYNFYPSVSPDSRWVVFSTGSPPGLSYFKFTEPQSNFSAYGQQSARLRLVSSQGGDVVELARATTAQNSTASWPAFAPFSQKDGSLHFIVFSSKLDYGFLLTQNRREAERERSSPGRFQVWVAGIDVSRVGDPSFAPFWLPEQPLIDVNHHGQWSESTGTSGCDL